MAKNLVIYYSRAGENYVGGEIKNLSKGNSEIAAEFIKNAVGADLFKVETIKSYSENYYSCADEAKRELENGERPKLKNYLSDISNYDNIFICGPCWWGTYPMAIFSQLEKLNWGGKKVIALMTHEGSGMGNSENDLRKVCLGAVFTQGLSVYGCDVAKSEKMISDWAKSQI